MSTTYIPANLRRAVIARANGRCEYCLINEEDTGTRHEVDHIVAEKHGGATTMDNLCHACFLCNRNKGSDVASYTEDGLLTAFFHPRNQVWSDHFQIVGSRIETRTGAGEVTAKLFQFNVAERCEERRGLQEAGRYPMEEQPM